MKNHKLFCIFLFLLLFPIGLYADENTKNEINAMDIIAGHTGDAYECHFFTWGKKHISIPLPIILYSKHTGFHCFLSNKVFHGATYEGFSIAPAPSKYEGKIVEYLNDGEIVRPIDLSITKNVVGLWASCIVICWIVLLLAKRCREGEDYLPSKGFLGIIDGLISMVYNDIIKPSVGEKYRHFAPYLLTAFLFIFFNNILGLIPILPFGCNITGNISITIVLALFTFFITNIFGTKHYWRDILWGDVPVWMKCPVPLMPIIEFFGIFTKPFALAIRLFANITAGHTITVGLIALIFIVAQMGVMIGTSMTFVVILMSVFMNFLELLVAYIQAYVFTMLSAVYIGLAQE